MNLLNLFRKILKKKEIKDEKIHRLVSYHYICSNCRSHHMMTYNPDEPHYVNIVELDSRRRCCFSGGLILKDVSERKISFTGK